MDLERQGEYRFTDLAPPTQDVMAEVLKGLENTPKTLSPKYFYDRRGSELFEQITRLDEYYLTRTELTLFDRLLPEVAEVVGHEVCVVEYGSGSSLKIRKVLEALTPLAYAPIDISSDHLEHNAKALHGDYPWLDVHAICTDLTRPFELPEPLKALDKVGFFPGSSIGNFDPNDAIAFLTSVKMTIGAGAYLLLGVDRKKAPEVLEAAYDDAAGVTAAFNLNALSHLNSIADADFDVNAFEHLVRYNETLGCIQMFLRSRVSQVVTLAGRAIEFEAGELVHTENSFKYHPEEFVELAAEAGFAVHSFWTDDKDLFSVFLLQA